MEDGGGSDSGSSSSQERNRFQDESPADKIIMNTEKIVVEVNENQENGGEVNKNVEIKEPESKKLKIDPKIRLTTSSVHREFSQVSKPAKKGGADVIYSKCNHCDIQLKGKNPTGLKQHLEAKHTVIYNKVREDKSKAKEELTKKKEENKPPVSLSGSNLKTARETLTGNLDKYVTTHKYAPFTKQFKEKLDKQLAYAIASNTSLPISIGRMPELQV